MGGRYMKRKFFLLFISSLFVPFFFPGCVPLMVGGAAAGAGAGTYYYINGELKADYNKPFDQVWTACEKTIASMHGTEVIPAKEIAKGTIQATISNEKVKFYITYKSKNVTAVAIRVGLIGNKVSSQRLHDKIADNLAKD
jgi:hypothetical protein